MLLTLRPLQPLKAARPLPPKVVRPLPPKVVRPLPPNPRWRQKSRRRHQLLR